MNLTETVTPTPPAAAATRGFYFDETNKKLYFDDGTWNLVGGADVAYKQLVALPLYIDKKSRSGELNVHGGISPLVTAQSLDATPTDISLTAGIGKLLIVVNAGADLGEDLTVTGTTVDRNTGVETPSDTNVITIGSLTTDASTTDSGGNPVYSFSNAYITSNWFSGAVTISTSELSLTDVDVYQVSFEQLNDEPSAKIQTLDFNAYATNSSAALYAHMYSLILSAPNVCTISSITDIELDSADVTANKYYRLRRGQLDVDIDGTTDGFWLDIYLDPAVSVYWEDINAKVWAEITKIATVS
jgi:hypothetical protein